VSCGLELDAPWIHSPDWILCPLHRHYSLQPDGQSHVLEAPPGYIFEKIPGDPHPPVTPHGIEALWRRVRFPSPGTLMERTTCNSKNTGAPRR
jgi:hypothetical protein